MKDLGLLDTEIEQQGATYLEFSLKPYITLKEFNKAITYGINNKDERNLADYVIASLISSIRDIDIPDTDDKYKVIFDNIEAEYIETMVDGYFQMRESYNNYPTFNSLEDVSNLELTLPISKKKVIPGNLVFNSETWDTIIDIKKLYNNELLGAKDIMVSQWLKGGIDELMQLPEQDVYYMSNFLLHVTNKLNCLWDLTPDQIAQWDNS